MAAATLSVVLALVIILGVAPAGASARSRTIVSLEFDHATSDELPGVQLAKSHGWPVTFFALSGRVGTPGYFTMGELLSFQALGDEIGGHTIDHMDLSKLSDAAQRAEICGDRAALVADGFDVTDFAYPYGHFNSATPGIARSCGYESARGAGGVISQGGCYGECPAAESIPPANPFDTRTANSVLDTTSVATIEGYVTRAERAGGGWLQIVFHRVCDGCDPYSISRSNLASFFTWLAGQPVSMETVRQVMSTPFSPGVVRVTGRASTVALRPGLACPSTPVTARCSLAPRLPSPKLRAVAGGAVTFTAPSPPKRIRLDLLIRVGGRLESFRRAATRSLAARWSVKLPRGAASGPATVEVRYPLGLARYRLSLSITRARHRRSRRS